MIGGGLVLAMSLAGQRGHSLGHAHRTGELSSSWTHCTMFFVDHMGGLALVVSRHFMSRHNVAGIVCVVGLLLSAFLYFHKGN